MGREWSIRKVHLTCAPFLSMSTRALLTLSLRARTICRHGATSLRLQISKPYGLMLSLEKKSSPQNAGRADLTRLLGRRIGGQSPGREAFHREQRNVRRMLD